MGTGSVAAGVYVRPFGSHANQSSPGVDSKLCSSESNRACIGRPFESLPESLVTGETQLGAEPPHGLEFVRQRGEDKSWEEYRDDN